MHFDSDNRPEDETKEQAAGAALFKAELMHFFSLMHGLALQNLRNDWCADLGLHLVLSCLVLSCFVLFCFVLFYFVLFCFVLFGLVWFGLVCFVLFEEKGVRHTRPCTRLATWGDVPAGDSRRLVCQPWVATSGNVPVTKWR
jgi:hypothetical protein